MIEFFFFGKPIKTLGSLGKIRVGRVTGNTHIFFWPKLIRWKICWKERKWTNERTDKPYVADSLLHSTTCHT